MKIRHPNCRHTYPRTDSVQYSLAFNHNSYSHPLTLLVLYAIRDREPLYFCDNLDGVH